MSEKIMRTPAMVSPEQHQDVEVDFEREEESFLEAIQKLKGEGAEVAKLTQRWEAEYNQLFDQDATNDTFLSFFKKFSSFLEKRRNALNAIDIPQDTDPQLAQELRDFDAKVARSFGKPDLFLGNGATAEVYEMLGHPTICVKYITDQGRYNEGNHMRTEFGFLKDLRGFTYGNVRTPTPYFLRIHPKDGHSYGMERIYGKSLSQILEKPLDAIDLIAVAKTLDRNKVIDEVRIFLDGMHARGVTHNDLRARNIMLGIDGSIVIIDFGKGKKDETEARHTAFSENDRAAAIGEIRQFFRKIDNINI